MRGARSGGIPVLSEAQRAYYYLSLGFSLEGLGGYVPLTWGCFSRRRSFSVFFGVDIIVVDTVGEEKYDTFRKRKYLWIF